MKFLNKKKLKKYSDQPKTKLNTISWVQVAHTKCLHLHSPRFHKSAQIQRSQRSILSFTMASFKSLLRITSPSSSSLILRKIRCMSNIPENTVYSGPTPQTQNKRVTLTQLRQKHRNSEPITMVTAYDYPSAVHIDMADIDICLVGDSAAMVVHGHDTTLPITIDEILVHCRAVARGAKRPLLVGDLPFGSYESSSNQVFFFPFLVNIGNFCTSLVGG